MSAPAQRVSGSQSVADLERQTNIALERINARIQASTGSGGVSAAAVAALQKQIDDLMALSGNDINNGGTGNPAPTPSSQTVTVDGFTITGDGNSSPLTGTVLAAFVITTNAFGASPYSATLTTLRTNYYRCSSSAGADFIFDLPAATGSGNVAIIKKIDANAHNIAVTPNGSDTIDGVNAAANISIQWTTLQLVDAASGAWETF